MVHGKEDGLHCAELYGANRFTDKKEYNMTLFREMIFHIFYILAEVTIRGYYSKALCLAVIVLI